MTSAEFAEWQAFQRLEGPVGPERDDWRHAQTTATVANANRDHRRHPRPYRPEEFIPDWAAANRVPKPARPQPSAVEVEEKMRTYFAGVGGGAANGNGHK